MLESYIFTTLFGVLWLPLIPAILCMILVDGKRLMTAGLLLGWLLISLFVFWMGFIHCFSGCVDPPWYLPGSGIAAIASGIVLFFVYLRWLIQRYTKRSR